MYASHPLARICDSSPDIAKAVTAMIGDRMDTDVLCGIEAGLETFLVLSGMTQADEILSQRLAKISSSRALA